MIRTQIQLSEEQARAMKAVAARNGVSMAEMIRRSVDELLRSEPRFDPERRRRALEIPAFHDIEGATDISVNHDWYLEGIYMDWYDKGRRTDVR